MHDNLDFVNKDSLDVKFCYKLTLAAFSGTSAVYEEGENSAGKSSASSIRIFSVVLELRPLPGPLSCSR